VRFGPLQYGDGVLLNISTNQSRLQKSVVELSSGLRINSAADDPSGLAIAESLRSVSQGLQEGTQQVQNAKNALTVADSAMQSVTKILQRMRSLVVEANSDVNSAQDKANIQAELDQLKLEINRIAENTNFNGKALLDGSLSSNAPNPAQGLVVQNPNVAGGGQFIQMQPVTAVMDGLQVSPYTEQCEFSFSIDSYDPTANQLNVTVTVQSSDPSFGPPQVSQFTVDAGTNFPSGFFPPTPGNPTYVITDAAGNPLVSFNTNNLNPADVGQTAIIATIPTQTPTPPGAHQLEVNLGTAEGDTLGISIDSVSTQNLGVSFTAVGNLLTNVASEQRLDNAIDQVTSQQAKMGAQEVALGYAADNNTTQYVQQVASESSIRDANIAQSVGDFTKEQILNQVGTSVLSQMEVSTSLLTNLLVAALGAQTIAASTPKG
jgi:flagellin